MIVVDLGMFYLYDRLGEAYQDKMQQRLLKEHMMAYQEQMHIMQQNQKKLDSLRHDMKNHMYLLQTYLNEGRYDKAQEYVNKMSEHLQTEHKYVNTGNLELDMILNHKLAKAEAMSCQIQSQIVIPCQLPVDGYDWNVLFGNLLDNAIEAMEQIKDRFLEIRIQYDRGILCIQVKNTFDGKVNKQGERLLTRKKQQALHGIGMQNISDVVDKYGGWKSINIDENIFEVQIVLYL